MNTASHWLRLRQVALVANRLEFVIGDLTDILGIEVYGDAALSPFEYDRSPCGLVVIWTKRRAPAAP